ncbi:MAG: hypothetical protein DMG22_20650 [Acidobacteria bacterium]|nr:MAG: hypothetical protein DMG22_20650 [Acidobacteriota bacterium]
MQRALTSQHLKQPLHVKTHLPFPRLQPAAIRIAGCLFVVLDLQQGSMGPGQSHRVDSGSMSIRQTKLRGRQIMNGRNTRAPQPDEAGD